MLHACSDAYPRDKIRLPVQTGAKIHLQRKSPLRIDGSKMRLFIASTLIRFATETGMASEILLGCGRG